VAAVRGVDGIPLTDHERWLAEQNLGLVYEVILRRFRYLHGDDRDDAVQDGFLGLVRAIRGHDRSKGELSTYADPWITKAINEGRGRLEGINYRRAVVRGETVPTTVSIHGVDEDGAALVDKLADASPDFTAAVDGRLDAEAAAGAIYRAIGQRRASDLLRSSAEVAARDDIGEAGVRKRRRRDAAAARAALGEAA
jgi:DNA-directed RNA polymerase specialized sigma24 family protein